MVETVIHLAENLTPIGLVGAPGIGKTSIALTVLHDDRIKRRFGGNRVFIRCDQFPATRNQFLRLLSKAIGAGIRNPENLASLHRFLSSKEMLIVIDNAEYILDPRGEIRADVDQLIQSGNICLCITSRVSTFPPLCEIIHIPTLSLEAAQDTFYKIYEHGEPTNQINDIFEQLDFHPLSITLLATVAHDNKWNTYELKMVWEEGRTGVLGARIFGSLATAIKLSLASPIFQELGPDARSLLEVVAFLPLGINEENTTWLFPTIPIIPAILGKLCVASLTYRKNGFVTMLAPLRGSLRPEDPASSSLLVATKDRYFARLSGSVMPCQLGFEEARWITTEDANIERLLEVFTTIDEDSERLWAACSGFMNRLYWHKPRLVTLGPKIEALPNTHPYKLQCLWDLSRLFESVGNYVERKRLLTYVLRHRRKEGNHGKVALTLRDLSDTNRRMGLYEEGMFQAKEAYKICERLGDGLTQAECLEKLASLLREDEHLVAAEEAVLRAIDLVSEIGQGFQLCELHRALGDIYGDKGEVEKAVHHFETALGISSSLNLNHATGLFWIHCGMARVCSGGGKFEDAQTHLEHAKSYAVDNMYLSAHVVQQQARLWDRQERFQDAKFEALSALDVFEKLEAANDAEATRQLLHQIEARLE